MLSAESTVDMALFFASVDSVIDRENTPVWIRSQARLALLDIPRPILYNAIARKARCYASWMLTNSKLVPEALDMIVDSGRALRSV